jgi:hypothetical protein
MSSSFTGYAENPYASPQGLSEVDVKPETAKPGSLAIVFGGFVLLLVGYLTSNLFLISDLYNVPFGPDDKPVPSPFAIAFTSPAALWGAYSLGAAAAIAGAVMIASQAFNPLAVVCYMFCPIAAASWLVGSPLRVARSWAMPVATLYLAVGSCLAGVGIIQLVSLYGQPNVSFAPVAASMITEVGLALIVGAGIKLSRIPAPAVAAQ